MLVKLRRLQNRLNREHIWDNLKTTASYEVVVFNKITKSSTVTPFTDLKQAFSSIYPNCKTQYNHEFYINSVHMKLRDWQLQELQEQEYLESKHLDDAYWQAKLEPLRTNEPPMLGVCINSNHDIIIVRATDRDQMNLLADAHNLKVLQSYEPKGYI
jgi:hypothetical protein